MVFFVRDFSTSSPLYLSASTDALVSREYGLSPCEAPSPVSILRISLLHCLKAHIGTLCRPGTVLQVIECSTEESHWSKGRSEILMHENVTKVHLRLQRR
jgi:hypothetical protein